MKKNKEILESTFEPNGFSIRKALRLEEDQNIIADPAYKRILSAMKKAQVEAIKELLRRKWKDSANAHNTLKYTSIDDIAVVLIKEIES